MEHNLQKDKKKYDLLTICTKKTSSKTQVQKLHVKKEYS